MKRHPWRTRAGLVGIVEAIAGVFIATGFTVEQVDWWMSVAGAVVSVLVAAGLVKDGERLTTPLSDPRDYKGRALRSTNPKEGQSE